MAAADLGFEATELRLGLPGGDGGEQARKRGFAETIDLKLKLEPAGEEEPAAAEEEVEVKAEVPESEEEKAADGGKMKRSPSQSSVVTAAAAAMADPAEKPRAPKYVGLHPWILSLFSLSLHACSSALLCSSR